MERKCLWLSYSWKDNVDDDIDFIASEIEKKDITVKLDRYVLISGQRLWSQIESHIVNPSECDAWGIFLTQNSLSSEAVREEIAYALDRALNTRGAVFPLIGINSGGVDRALVPVSISSRLYVDLTDRDWLERVVSGVRGHSPQLERAELMPVLFKEYEIYGRSCIEARPRAGRWFPGIIAVPEDEWHCVDIVICAPAGKATMSGETSSQKYIGQGPDGRRWRGIQLNKNITPLYSLYLTLKSPVSSVLSGDLDGPKYEYRPVRK